MIDIFSWGFVINSAVSLMESFSYHNNSAKKQQKQNCPKISLMRPDGAFSEKNWLQNISWNCPFISIFALFWSQFYSPQNWNVCFQDIGSPQFSVLLEDILSLAQSDQLIMKIDIEGYECKVNHLSSLLKGP